MRTNLFLALLILSFSQLYAQTEKEKVEATVSKSSIEGHIYFLADDLLKGRETGTPENKIAASYLANTLRSYGVQPVSMMGSYYQSVSLKKITPPNRIMVRVDGEELKYKVAFDTDKFETKGASAIYMGYGLAEDYAKNDVAKKIVIIKAGSPESLDARKAYGLRETKMELAKNAGAVGIIELVQVEANIWSFIDHQFNAEQFVLDNDVKSEEKKEKAFPYIWVHDETGIIAQQYNSNPKPLSVDLQISGATTEKIVSQNVIGKIEGTDPVLKNEYVIYSAHYDHVGVGTPDKTGDTIYNGARDNAVGATTVLSMAENLAKYPTKRSALFILFTGEEKGLLGSEYYVNNPVLPLEQMVYCFNSDNAGYNDTSFATVIGLTRTTGEANIVSAVETFGLKANEDPAPEQGLFDRSDNVHFAAVGIPAPTFSLGFTSFDGTVTEFYHQPGDEANTLDYNYLLKFFQAYVLAGRNIANDPVTPVWKAGDKYEAVSKKLYQK